MCKLKESKHIPLNISSIVLCDKKISQSDFWQIHDDIEQAYSLLDLDDPASDQARTTWP